MAYVKDLLTEQFSKKHVDNWGARVPVLDELFKALFIDQQLDLLALLNQKTLIRIANHQDCTWPIIYAILRQDPSLTSQIPLSKIQIDGRMVNSWQELLALNVDIKSKAVAEKNNLIQSLLKEYEDAARGNVKSVQVDSDQNDAQNGSQLIPIHDNRDLKNRIKRLGGTTKEIDDTIEKELSEQFGIYLRELREGGVNPRLIANFSLIREDCERLGITYYAGCYLSGSNRPTSTYGLITKSGNGTNTIDNDLYNELVNLISLSSSYARTFHSNKVVEYVSPVKYGLKNDDDLIEQLEALYKVYQCLGVGERFYQDLEGQMSISFKQENFNPQSDFIGEAIKKKLLSYLDNEIAVCIAGKRENRSYKASSYLPTEDKKNPFQLVSLYIRLKEIERLRTRIKGIYSSLIQFQEDFRKRGSTDAYLQAVQHLNSPLNVYFAIAGATGIEDPYLKGECIQTYLLMPSTTRKQNIYSFTDDLGDGAFTRNAVKMVPKCFQLLKKMNIKDREAAKNIFISEIPNLDSNRECQWSFDELKELFHMMRYIQQHNNPVYVCEGQNYDVSALLLLREEQNSLLYHLIGRHGNTSTWQLIISNLQKQIAKKILGANLQDSTESLALIQFSSNRLNVSWNSGNTDALNYFLSNKK